MSKVTPLDNMGRTPEQGRIRLGVKTERAMKAIDTFRFTSSVSPAGGATGTWEANNVVDGIRITSHNKYEEITAVTQDLKTNNIIIVEKDDNLGNK